MERTGNDPEPGKYSRYISIGSLIRDDMSKLSSARSQGFVLDQMDVEELGKGLKQHIIHLSTAWF